jgi:putative two-component system response regulator
MVRQVPAQAQAFGETDWQRLERSSILVVDDDPGVRDTVSRCLQLDGYSVCGAATLGEARDALASRDVFIVLTDITLAAGESGLDLLAELHEQRPALPVLMMTANSELESAVQALKQGAYDYLCKPFPFEVVRAAVRRVVEHLHAVEKAAMFDELETRKQADDESVEQFLVSMATAVDAKSRFTARHGTRVSGLCRVLGEALGYDKKRTQLVALGGRLHDIGKIGTPDAILDKPGPLTREEYAVMKEHPATGDELIAPVKVLAQLRPMIRWHHESLDGRGYPDALPGDQVPEEAWVVKVADYWEAITARRPYRDPMPLEKAVACLRGEAGLRIPEDFVEVFLEAIQGAPIALTPPA